jgi:hypothetical protein
MVVWAELKSYTRTHYARVGTDDGSNQEPEFTNNQWTSDTVAVFSKDARFHRQHDATGGGNDGSSGTFGTSTGS